VPSRLRACDDLEIANDLIHVHGDSLQLASPEQGGQALDQVGGPRGVIGDVADRVIELGGQHATGQQAPRRLRVRPDRGQRLIQLVGEGDREVPKGHDPSQVGQLLAQAAHRLVRLAALHGGHHDLAGHPETLDVFGHPPCSAAPQQGHGEMSANPLGVKRLPLGRCLHRQIARHPAHRQAMAATKLPDIPAEPCRKRRRDRRGRGRVRHRQRVSVIGKPREGGPLHSGARGEPREPLTEVPVERVRRRVHQRAHEVRDEALESPRRVQRLPRRRRSRAPVSELSSHVHRQPIEGDTKE
jgi:hypothetical protein